MYATQQLYGNTPHTHKHAHTAHEHFIYNFVFVASGSRNGNAIRPDFHRKWQCYIYVAYVSLSTINLLQVVNVKEMSTPDYD